MERSFPRNTRRHVSWTVALLSTIALAAAPAMVQNARADDLKDKQSQVKKGVKKASHALEESSAAFTVAHRRLTAAQGRLAAAQKVLATTQGELTAARVLDTQMQAKLATAVANLKTAEAELVAGEKRVVEQRAAVGRAAAASFQYGSPELMRMSVLLQGRSPEEMSVQLATIDSVMNRETATLDDLRVAEAQLELQRNKVEATKAEVADRRQDAAVNLARKQALEARAVANRARVAALVTVAAKASAAARVARAADLRKLRQLKKEEARIKRMILARAKNQGKGYTGGTGGFLLAPVANSYITSPYGWRKHPIYGYWGLHDGDDFHAPCGAPLRASASGTVISRYYSDVWGNRLFLDVGKVNGKSMTLIYNHISSYRSGVGERVARGETVALAGTTGWSTGCHLHFTVMLNGNPVNPQGYM